MPQFPIPASKWEEQSYCSVSAPTPSTREESGAPDDHSGHPLPAPIKPTALPWSLASAGCYTLLAPMLSLVLISVCVDGERGSGDHNFDPELSYRSYPHQKCTELFAT